MIYIYDDGVHANAYIQMALQCVGCNNTHFCNASMILDGCLGSANLLIMPGGADLFFCEKLSGQGNEIIRRFVEKGGSYLGICAGAYYACETLDWACGEIKGDRELSFYKGKATGPIYEWLEKPNDIYNGSWIKAVEIETSDGQKFLTQYNGGPVLEESNEAQVIACYSGLENSPAAIVQGEIGQGKYILSSPHIENFGHFLSDGLYKHLNNSYEREKDEINDLLEHTQAQKEFFKTIIERLL